MKSMKKFETYTIDLFYLEKYLEFFQSFPSISCSKNEAWSWKNVTLEIVI